MPSLHASPVAMPSFLFWNINNRSIAQALKLLVEEHSVDVLILAECRMSISEVLMALNSNSLANGTFSYASSPDSDHRIKIFVKYNSNYVTPFYDANHFTIRRVMFPLTEEILLVAVHLPSRLAEDKSDLDEHAGEVAAIIREREMEAGHSRTLIIGDFNMNPFSGGMIKANAFNAVSVRQIANQLSRTHKGMIRKYFYNPMWSFFSEVENRSPGTYFYNPNGYESIHWNIFDQVLIRPELISNIVPNSLKIISRCDALDSLCTQHGRPSLSDHFPIAITLK